MMRFTSRTGSAATNESHAPVAVPASCPTCGSSSIVTSAKSPDAGSYWRCTSCGEIWNDSRGRGLRHPSRRWR